MIITLVILNVKGRLLADHGSPRSGGDLDLLFLSVFFGLLGTLCDPWVCPLVILGVLGVPRPLQGGMAWAYKSLLIGIF